MIFVSVFVNDQLVDKMGNHFIDLLGSSVVKMWNLFLHVMQSICLYADPFYAKCVPLVILVKMWNLFEM